jgi:hypothetical protein
MPFIDKECEGPGATHHFACKCREEYFAKLREALEYIAEMPNRIGIDADCEGAPAKDCWHIARAALEGK